MTIKIEFLIIIILPFNYSIINMKHFSLTISVKVTKNESLLFPKMRKICTRFAKFPKIVTTLSFT